MKAIILAAGKGSRFGEITNNTPKCMLNFIGKPILYHQIDTLKKNGIKDIIIIKGYLADKIQYPNTRSYINKNYNTTNMLHSLFCAEKELKGNVIISYADIIYENTVLSKLIDDKNNDISVVIDKNWYKYYKKRFNNPLLEAESLILNKNNEIINIGAQNKLKKEIQGQYIGLIRLSNKGCEIFKNYYYRIIKLYSKQWKFREKYFKDLFMTDFLQLLINNGFKIKAIPVLNGWLEFDTYKDYNLAIKWHKNNLIKEFYRDNL